MPRLAADVNLLIATAVPRRARARFSGGGAGNSRRGGPSRCQPSGLGKLGKDGKPVAARIHSVSGPPRATRPTGSADQCLGHAHTLDIRRGRLALPLSQKWESAPRPLPAAWKPDGAAKPGTHREQVSRRTGDRRLDPPPSLLVPLSSTARRSSERPAGSLTSGTAFALTCGLMRA